MKKSVLYIILSLTTASIFLLLTMDLINGSYQKQKYTYPDANNSTTFTKQHSTINTFPSIYKSNVSDVQILIDINEKMLYVVSNDQIKAKYPIASGKPDTPSPIGDFLIIQRARWGEGFGSAWLGLNVPWGKYGIHGTLSPGSIGSAASHGCIRMRNRDVDKLYSLVKVGTPVKIVGGHYGLLGNGYRVLSPGDRGGDVMLVQNKLKGLGFYNGSLDGIYGTGMEKALNRFQESKKLPITNRINEKLYREMGIMLFE